MAVCKAAGFSTLRAAFSSRSTRTCWEANSVAAPLCSTGHLSTYTTFRISVGPLRAGGLYLLQGAAYGTLPNGSNGQAFINETFYGSFNSKGMFTGTVVSGSIDVNPEPGTLGLFATGLVGVAGAVRRKLRT